MKTIISTLLVLFAFTSFAQEDMAAGEDGFDKIESYGKNQLGWAMVWKNELAGFIDVQGTVVIPVEFEKIERFDRWQIGWAIVWKEGKAGFIDDNGNVIVEPKYDKIGKLVDGRAKVWLNEKVGLIDENGQELVRMAAN